MMLITVKTRNEDPAKELANGSRFWMSKGDGTLHPDSFRKVTVTPTPGGCYQLITPLSIFNRFGHGD